MTVPGAAASEPAATDQSLSARPREWLGLGVLALACVVYAMDLTVLELAVPALTVALHPTGAELLWIVDIYGFFVAGLLITMGGLGDRIGRRRLLLVGAAGFSITSVLAAFSTSALMLIAARALLGIAGASVGPSTLSLIRTMFRNPAQRTIAVGVWLSSFSAGAVIGPLVGGMMLEFFWWGSVFLLAVPVMGLLLFLGPRLLPEDRDPSGGHLDLVSSAMSLIAILAIVYGLTLSADGSGSPVALAPVLSGLALAVVFVRRQRGARHPLIDLALFRNRRFSASLTVYALAFVAFGGTSFLMAQYLQLVVGLSPFEAGVFTVPQFVGFIVGSMLTPIIARRVRPPVAVAGGLAVAGGGFGLIALSHEPWGLPTVVAGSVVVALGLAPAFTLATDIMVGSSPPERAGSAAAISETGSELGGALGVALLGGLATAVFRTRFAETIPPSIVQEPARIAQDTLGGAVVVAGQLPSPRGMEVLTAAHGAFMDGFHLVAWIGVLTVSALSVLAARNLRESDLERTTPTEVADGH